MKTWSVVEVKEANITLPEMDLHYVDANGQMAGGFSCVSMVPIEGIATAIVEIDTSPTIMTAIKTSGLYPAWQDVVEVTRDG